MTMTWQAISDRPYVAASLDRRYELRSIWARGQANELLGRLEAAHDDFTSMIITHGRGRAVQVDPRLTQVDPGLTALGVSG